MRTAKALFFEFLLPYSDCSVVLPIVQIELNAIKHRRLGNRAPLTVFTDLPSCDRLGAIKGPEGTPLRILQPDES